MKKNTVLFAHDGPLYRVEGNGSYYGVSLTDGLRQRYLLLGKKVSFLMRVYSISFEHSKTLSLFSDENFSVIAVPNFKSIFLYFKNYFKAKKIIREAVRTHDILVVRLPSAIGTMAVSYARKFNKPILAECVACTFDAYWNHGWQGKIIAYYKMLSQKRLMRDMRYSMYVTREFLQKRYPTKGGQIDCSDVELDEMDRADLIVRNGKIEKLTDKKQLVIGTVAALDVLYKGQADVIKAISILKKKGLLFQYKLVGQGDSSRLARLIKEEGLQDLVEIISSLKHKEVFNFLKQIDLYIQPSKQEGLPRALIEAMSKACPAFGSNAGGIPELLSEEYIFEAGNIDQIVKKLQGVSKAGMLKQAEQNFSMAINYQKNVLHARRARFYNLFLTENGMLDGRHST